MTIARAASSTTEPRRVIDACVYPAWPGIEVLAARMEAPWRELLLRPGDRQGPVSVLSPRLYQDPDGPEPVPIQRLHARFLSDRYERMVLGWDDGLFATAFPYRHIARRVVQAANDWLIDVALDAEGCYGMMLISSAIPSDAAAEIRRVGADERVVAVAIGCNVLGRPFGDHIYLPIFEAAAEMQLPIVLQTGSDATTDLITPPLAGGLPATYAEYWALNVHSHMSHVSSMILEGLFDRFPELRVLLVGGGFAWIPSWLWRLNLWFKRGRRTQAPWLRRLPSEYFAEHVFATTSPELSHSGFSLDPVLSAASDLDLRMVFASCFPSERSPSPEKLAAVLPPDWHEPVFRLNAEALFRWPTPLRDAAPMSTAPAQA